mmetsp:Transcript_13954/g.27565  ORF Transcript_13954/g.27565 Transcript_13954/m.27565 type:complete len:234 (-) Transcript_13954:1026-1727(-)
MQTPLANVFVTLVLLCRTVHSPQSTHSFLAAPMPVLAMGSVSWGNVLVLQVSLAVTAAEHLARLASQVPLASLLPARGTVMARVFALPDNACAEKVIQAVIAPCQQSATMPAAKPAWQISKVKLVSFARGSASRLQSRCWVAMTRLQTASLLHCLRFILPLVTEDHLADRPDQSRQAVSRCPGSSPRGLASLADHQRHTAARLQRLAVSMAEASNLCIYHEQKHKYPMWQLLA